MRRQALLLILIASLGCRHTQVAEDEEAPPGDRTKAGFPTVQALEGLAQRAAPVEELGTSASLEVEHWALTGPFPTGFDEPHPGDGPLAKTLATELAKGKKPRGMSHGMHCAAREVGLFFLEHQKLPSPLLTEFVGARCHATDPLFGIRTMSWTTTGKVDPAKLIEAAIKAVPDMVGAIGAENTDLGVWYGVKGDRVVAIVTGGLPRAFLTEVTVDGGTLHVRGRSVSPIASVRGVATRGSAGYEECEPDLKGSDFELSCPVSLDDPSVTLDISGAPPNRWVASNLTTVVQPLRAPSPEYSGLTAAPSTTALSRIDLQRNLRAAIQQARRENGLQPLTFEAVQSEAIDSVTGHYFAGINGLLPPETVDLVALGAQAGWKVGAKIRRGTFVSSASQGGTGLTYLIGAMLARPTGRSVVLDPEASRLAIGLHVGNNGFSGAIVSTYRVLDPKKEPTIEAGAWAALQKGRAAFSRAPAERLDPLGEDTLAQLRAAPAASADRALNLLLADTARRFTGQHVRGWYLEIDDPADLTFPQELLQAPELRCVFVLAHYRPRYEPWARFVLFVLVPSLTMAEVTPTAIDPIALAFEAHPN